MEKINVYLKMKNSYAEGVYDIESRGILVKAGAIIEKTTAKSFESSNYRKLREQLINQSIINQDFKLTQDHKFNSLSSAAAVIGGRQAAGPNEWKTKDDVRVADLDLSTDSDVSLDSSEEQYNYLTTFMEDIDILNKLKDETDFNVFETLALVNNEIRHSNVLSWLLNPYETHELGDYFTKQFIRSVYKKNKRLFTHKNLKTEDVFLWDFDDVEVLREHKDIDILILDKKHHLAVVIENKVRAKEHSNQLKKYEKTVNEMPDIKYRMFVYLTVDGADSSDPSVWANFSYDDILELLDSVRDIKASEKIKNFVEDYKAILRRYLLTDSKIQKICNEIYSKHKKALDLIYEYRPDIISEIHEAIDNMMSNFDEYVKTHSIKTVFRFTDERLRRINTHYKDVSNGWLKDNSIIVHELRISDKHLKIATLVGPSDDDSRNEIIDYYYNQPNTPSKRNTSKYETLKSTLITKIDSEENINNIIKKIEGDFERKINSHVNTVKEAFQDFKV